MVEKKKQQRFETHEFLARYSVCLPKELLDEKHVDNMLYVQRFFPDGNWIVEIFEIPTEGYILIVPLEEDLAGENIREKIDQYEINCFNATLFKPGKLYRIQKKRKSYEVTEYKIEEE